MQGKEHGEVRVGVVERVAGGRPRLGTQMGDERHLDSWNRASIMRTVGPATVAGD